MPVTRPEQFISMDPRLRGPGERFRGQIQISWSPGDDCYVIGVTVWQGEDDQDLRSLCVAAPTDWFGARAVAHSALFDLLELVRRTDDPFDDLL